MTTAQKSTQRTSEVSKVVSDPGRTKRAKAFRERLGSSDLNRWEIYTSESIKNQVRGIAKSEGLSSGVAAEALLRLGIEAYRATTLESSAKRDSSKPLSSYSSRTGSSLGATAQNTSASEKATNVVKGFMERAAKRGKSV